MKKVFLTMMTVCLLLTGCSQDEFSVYGGIYGTIRDAVTGTPIYNAEITLSPGNRTTVSGSDGSYEYQNMDSGQYSISVNAAGYQYNSRTVSVVAGESTLCDMHLYPESPMSGVEVSATSLNFDTTYNELTFEIRNTGTSGPVEWSITGIHAAWLTVTPMSGTTDMGKSSSVKVSVNRSLITENTSALFTVNAAGGSKSIMVSVRTNNGDNNGGGNVGGGTTEDYSSAVITSCDYRILVKIIDCKRSGSSVLFNYTLTNTGWEILNSFNMLHPDYYYNAPSGQKTYIYDDLGNEYTDVTLYIGNAYTSSSIVFNSLPKDLPRKCSITIKDVSSAAKTLTLRLACFAEPTYQFDFGSEVIKFDNLPVY